MKIKRLVASISASFEDLVGKVENHEAVADIAIREVQQAAAKLRGQIQNVKNRYHHQQKQEQTLVEQCDNWRRRAVKVREHDEEKALRCVHSLKTSEHTLASLRTQLSESEQLLRDMECQLREVESRLYDLQAKKASLSARSYRNKTMRYSLQSAANCETEAVFSRWEEAVCTDEYSSMSVLPGMDSLDQEFREQENHDYLKRELEALMAQSNAAEGN